MREDPVIKTYLVVIEEAPQNCAAYVLDFRGCIATGETVEEVTTNIRPAISRLLEALREDGIETPASRAGATLVDV